MRCKQYINEKVKHYLPKKEQLEVIDYIYEIFDYKINKDLGLNPPPLLKLSYIKRPFNENINDDLKDTIEDMIEIINEETTTSSMEDWDFFQKRKNMTDNYQLKSVEIINRLKKLNPDNDDVKNWLDTLDKILLKIYVTKDDDVKRKYLNHTERLLTTML